MISVLGPEGRPSFPVPQKDGAGRTVCCRNVLNRQLVALSSLDQRLNLKEKRRVSCGNVAMVFREAAHIQLNTRLYIVAARVSCPISDRDLSV